MVVLQGVITFFYYLLVACAAALMLWNLVRSRKWEEEVLYILVVLPFLLRLFRLK